jgi:protein O-GlcNAc transferase
MSTPVILTYFILKINRYEKGVVLSINSSKIIYQKIAQLFTSGDLGSAKIELEDAIKIFGNTHNSFFYGGAIAFAEDEITKAIELFGKAAKLEPENIQTAYNYGMALARDRVYADAMACFRTVINKEPNHTPSLLMIATIFDKTGNPFAAESTAKIVLSLSPNEPTALEIIAGSAKNIGNMDQAVESYKSILEIYPQNFSARSSMLFAINYGTFSADEIRDIHRENGNYFVSDKQFEQPKTVPQSDKITVGFVSADFCLHSVAYFLESILSNFDKKRFNIIAYSNTEHKDKVTDRFKSYCTGWRDINSMSALSVAECVKKDLVDILIDLSGHTGGYQLLTFGMKPAPIQLSYIGYPASTGLSTIDYRITDSVADPVSEQFEPLIRLKNFFLAYTPPEHLPPTNFEATKNRDHTLFGSFNNTAKYSDKTVALWSRVLKSVSNSKLLIKHRHFNDPKLKQNMLNRFLAEGVLEDQLVFKEYSFTDVGHLEEYNSIDLALDCTPYNGTTTTFEAAVMGVPTISLRGDHHSDRVGVSILSTLKMNEFIAETEDEFVEIAQKFDSDRLSLLSVKRGLRESLLNSPLCDGKALTTELEDVFEELIVQYSN